MHESARPHAPGLVELWPVETPAEEEEPEAWVLPVDEPEQQSPPVVVARRIAQAVKCWTTKGDEMGRVWTAGDVLVLVRKRGAAFEAVIRALKEAGVPVAGADRLNIGEHIAVLDLVAAGRAALLPDDDLTLATALKSPLVGLTDDDLIRIAADPRRGRIAARGACAPCGQRRCEGAARMRSVGRVARAGAPRMGPFGFFATLLGPRGGRSQLVARLGSEAGDAIDAFLCFAHQSEMTETPSLTVFLNRFESASHTIKRDLDSVNNEVRVMTVHGAKGLEAPIVVLIDGCEVLGRDPRAAAAADGNGDTVPVWSPRQGLRFRARSRQAARSCTRKGSRGAQPAALRGHDPRQGPAGDRALSDEPQGLAAGGLVRDDPPRARGEGRRPRTRSRRPMARSRSGATARRSRAPLAAESDVAPLDPIAVPDWLTRAMPSRARTPAAAPRPRARSAPPTA